MSATAAINALPSPPDDLTADEIAAACRATERRILGQQCWHLEQRVFSAECWAIKRTRIPSIRAFKLPEKAGAPLKVEEAPRTTMPTVPKTVIDDRAAEMENLQFLRDFLARRSTRQTA